MAKTMNNLSGKVTSKEDLNLKLPEHKTWMLSTQPQRLVFPQSSTFFFMWGESFAVYTLRNHTAHYWTSSVTDWQTNKFTHSLLSLGFHGCCDVQLWLLALRCTECWFPNISAYTPLDIFNVLGGLLCRTQNRWRVECEDMTGWTAPLVPSNHGLTSNSMPTSRSVQGTSKPPAHILALKMAAANIYWNGRPLTFYTASSRKQKSYVNQPTIEPIKWVEQILLQRVTITKQVEKYHAFYGN
jgi:hypothetical protein